MRTRCAVLANALLRSWRVLPSLTSVALRFSAERLVVCQGAFVAAERLSRIGEGSYAESTFRDPMELLALLTWVAIEACCLSGQTLLK